MPIVAAVKLSLAMLHDKTSMVKNGFVVIQGQEIDYAVVMSPVQILCFCQFGA